MHHVGSLERFALSGSAMSHRIVFLGEHFPCIFGIATFTYDLTGAVAEAAPESCNFTLLGIQGHLQHFTGNAAINAMRSNRTERIMALWKTCSTEDCSWFEDSVSDGNACFSEALIFSGQLMPNPDALKGRLKSLRWLLSIQKTQSGGLHPFGSNCFYDCDGIRADFDHQPLQAHAKAATYNEASRATQDASWSCKANHASEWFLGGNDLGLPRYDFATVGCGDELYHARVNQDQGAESTLAFHLSLAEINCAKIPTQPPQIL